MKKITFVKTTVRETASEARVAKKVAAALTAENGRKVSVSKAYLQAMAALAFNLGI